LHNNASQWRSKTQFSVVELLPHFYRHPGLDPGSILPALREWTPDQVRGDDENVGNGLATENCVFDRHSLALLCNRLKWTA
jgi:hypothetical protein